MKEVYREYFASLDGAKAARNKKQEELLQQPYYFDCSVWDCTDPWAMENKDHWVNGEFLRYSVIACVWEDQKVR